MSAERRAELPPIDPVDLAVLSSRFTAIVRAMSNTLIRAGRSVILNTGRDFSCCVITAQDELLAMADSVPLHVLSGADLMARSMRELHPGLKPGDAFLHNSPYHGNSHPADLSILIPVFDDQGAHRFTVMSKAHLADIGNAEPTPYSAMARDVYEEGAVIFPCVQVQQDYADIPTSSACAGCGSACPTCGGATISPCLAPLGSASATCTCWRGRSGGTGSTPSFALGSITASGR